MIHSKNGYLYSNLKRSFLNNNTDLEPVYSWLFISYNLDYLFSPGNIQSSKHCSNPGNILSHFH